MHFPSPSSRPKAWVQREASVDTSGRGGATLADQLPQPPKYSFLQNADSRDTISSRAESARRELISRRGELSQYWNWFIHVRICDLSNESFGISQDTTTILMNSSNHPVQKSEAATWIVEVDKYIKQLGAISKDSFEHPLSFKIVKLFIGLMLGIIESRYYRTIDIASEESMYIQELRAVVLSPPNPNEDLDALIKSYKAKLEDLKKLIIAIPKCDDKVEEVISTLQGAFAAVTTFLMKQNSQIISKAEEACPKLIEVSDVEEKKVLLVMQYTNTEKIKSYRMNFRILCDSQNKHSIKIKDFVLWLEMVEKYIIKVNIISTGRFDQPLSMQTVKLFVLSMILVLELRCADKIDTNTKYRDEIVALEKPPLWSTATNLGGICEMVVVHLDKLKILISNLKNDYFREGTSVEISDTKKLEDVQSKLLTDYENTILTMLKECNIQIRTEALSAPDYPKEDVRKQLMFIMQKGLSNKKIQEKIISDLEDFLKINTENFTPQHDDFIRWASTVEQYKATIPLHINNESLQHEQVVPLAIVKLFIKCIIKILFHCCTKLIDDKKSRILLILRDNQLSSYSDCRTDLTELELSIMALDKLLDICLEDEMTKELEAHNKAMTEQALLKYHIVPWCMQYGDFDDAGKKDEIAKRVSATLNEISDACTKETQVQAELIRVQQESIKYLKTTMLKTIYFDREIAKLADDVKEYLQSIGIKVEPSQSRPVEPAVAGPAPVTTVPVTEVGMETPSERREDTSSIDMINVSMPYYHMLEMVDRQIQGIESDIDTLKKSEVESVSVDSRNNIQTKIDQALRLTAYLQGCAQRLTHATLETDKLSMQLLKRSNRDQSVSNRPSMPTIVSSSNLTPGRGVSPEPKPLQASHSSTPLGSTPRSESQLRRSPSVMSTVSVVVEDSISLEQYGAWIMDNPEFVHCLDILINIDKEQFLLTIKNMLPQVEDSKDKPIPIQRMPEFYFTNLCESRSADLRGLRSKLENIGKKDCVVM